MNSRHLLLDSPAMGRKVHVWAYGHYGEPVVVFPSAAGFAHEWAKEGMLDALGPLLRAGRIKLYCPESNVSEAWTKKNRPLADRMARHHEYERFVVDTLVPFVRSDCNWPDAPLAASGCSLGAMYAANFALKQPEIFRRAVCFSGRYLATALTGESSTAVYFNSPIAFVPNLQGDALDRVRRNTHLTLVCGQGAYEEGCIEETIFMGKLLPRMGIPSTTDIWGRESRHGWGWWQKQARKHFWAIWGQ